MSSEDKQATGLVSEFKYIDEILALFLLGLTMILGGFLHLFFNCCHPYLGKMIPNLDL